MVKSFGISICVPLLIVFSTFPVVADELDASSAYNLAKIGQLTIVDIRRPAEWRKTGMPDKSRGVSLQNVIKRVRARFLEDVLTLTGGDKNQALGLICASGGRSAYATEFLKKEGFSNIYDISEGMFGNDRAPGWIARKLPLVSCNGC